MCSQCSGYAKVGALRMNTNIRNKKCQQETSETENRHGAAKKLNEREKEKWTSVRHC